MHKQNRTALAILLLVVIAQGILVTYTLSSLASDANDRDEVAARHIGAALAVSVAPLLRQAADTSSLEALLDIVRSEKLIGYAAIMRNGRVLASGSNALSQADRQLLTLVKQSIGSSEQPLGEIVLGVFQPKQSPFGPFFISMFISVTGMVFLLLNYYAFPRPKDTISKSNVAGFMADEEYNNSEPKGARSSVRITPKITDFGDKQVENIAEENLEPEVIEHSEKRQDTRKRLEDKFLHTLFTRLSDPVIITDQNCEVLTCNPATRDMFGWRKTEIVGKNIGYLIHSEEKPENRLTCQDLVCSINAGETLKFFAKNQNGERFPVEVDINLVDSSNRDFFIIRIRDISELEIVQTELRLADHAFQSTDAMFIADQSGVILRVNRSFSEITGYDAEEVIGKPMTLLAATNGEVTFYQAIRRSLARENKWRGELLHKQKSGNVIPILVFATAMRERNGTLTHFIAHFIDVSEQKRNEQALRDAQQSAEQANVSKGRFLAAMSHEIRTPMNGVLGVLELITESTLSAQQRKLLQTAQHSGNLLLSIINDILDFSRLEAGKLKLADHPMDLTELVRQTTDILLPKAQSKKLTLNLDVSATVPRYVSGDADRLRQILLNLIGNAIKYTEYGEINVSLFNSNHRADSCNLTCTISDTGIGISPESLPTIFDEFSTAENARHYKNDSTGLGLFICKQLITLMGGDIEISSTPGVGTRVRFDISLSPASHSTVSSQIPRPLIHQTLHQRIRKDIRILVAEDNVANQLVIRSMLELDNLTADIVNNGAEAIAAVKRNDYDIILMDISMPSVNGIEATQSIREMPSPKNDVSIIALTSHALSNDQEKFINSGMNDCVTKPIDRTTLLTTLVKWQDKSANFKAPLQIEDEVIESKTYQRLDMSRLDDLCNDVDPDMIEELIKVYARDTRHRIYSIYQATDEQNLDKLKFEAHSIVSSAETHGNALLSKLCKTLEMACEDNDQKQALIIAEDVVQEAEMSLQALEQMVRTEWPRQQKA
ncbi:hypothetical protein CS022_08195 [Veronia nyctiphanis]|uniref:histidine kinase n=1 Tax=Veronia nyctiphanis TaxID=1278244 RepID=A0A4Q0YRG7_9GAMM|nr:PAS domain S-box protein [Veronia nyctiphanis]RXJ73706.1 hypothetical protein CS022_08195 [Veronia nyctiphanis]